MRGLRRCAATSGVNQARKDRQTDGQTEVHGLSWFITTGRAINLSRNQAKTFVRRRRRRRLTRLNPGAVDVHRRTAGNAGHSFFPPPIRISAPGWTPVPVRSISAPKMTTKPQRAGRPSCTQQGPDFQNFLRKSEEDLGNSEVVNLRRSYDDLMKNLGKS